MGSDLPKPLDAKTDAEVTATVYQAYELLYASHGKARDVDKAIVMLKEAAAKGSIEALQFCYHNWHKTGYKQDADKALALAKHGAEQKRPIAAYQYASMINGKPDELKYLEIAAGAEKPIAPALFDLGYAYLRGTSGAKADPVKALDLVKRAANEMQFPEAWEAFGTLYDSGLPGTEIAKDEAKGFECYCKAAAMGSWSGAFNAGWDLEKGCGVAADQAKAIEYYRMAAKGGHQKAIAKLTHFGVSV